MVKKWYCYKVYMCKILDEPCDETRMDLNQSKDINCDDCEIYQEWKKGELENE